MACRVVIESAAAREYRQIVSYLADVLKSPSAARGFVDTFDEQVNLLREHPEMWPLSSCKELAHLGYRRFRVGSYLVLYKVTADAVLIAHIVHQSQDYARLV
jgi:plasmid stabilization system protein ParE